MPDLDAPAPAPEIDLRDAIEPLEQKTSAVHKLGRCTRTSPIRVMEGTAMSRNSKRSPKRVGLSLGVLAAALVFFPILPALATPGQVLDNSGIIPLDQAFFAFEVEGPIGSLKDVPIWDEIELMLDNPYAIQLEPNVGGNAQGWPSYRSTDPRRRSFIYRNAAGNPCAPGTSGCNEVPLERHVVHPLNYNHSTGEELRLLNIEFEGAEGFLVPDDLVEVDCAEIPPPTFPPNAPLPEAPAGCFEWTYEPVDISPGELRIEDDEAATDFNSPLAPDTLHTIVNLEANPPEGSWMAGADPGEPGYAGFGVLLEELGDPGLDDQYSTPAVPGPSEPDDSVIGYQLFDPARGFIEPRDPVTGAGGLRKPSLRVPELGGSPTSPNYAINSAANLEVDPIALAPSNENDYVTFAGRADSTALGKALFWDMQVGSDGVQACGSCHFHAGADNRTKAQLNPNDVGGDLDLEVFGNRAVPPANPQNNNQDVVVGDFPFHKLIDLSIPGERASDGDGIVDHNPDNVASHSNDVMSSMGVKFGKFHDIPTPGGGRGSSAFVQLSGNTPRPLKPDLRSPNPADNVDPIPLFQGLRRVEPRNTPTLFASAMNFDNFWDGRARHDFQGGSVFGASDPGHHVFVNNGAVNGPLTATRQIIRFVSLASLSTGPVLSKFEMSFEGRNWAKVGKKLLQVGVVPLANQLVSTSDSVLGRYSNQGGSACAGLPAADRSGPGSTALNRPGLCISYNALIRRSFYSHLWAARSQHLNGAPDPGDPFDLYSLTIAAGNLTETGDANMNGVPDGLENTNQFTQMEANFSLFFGLSVHKWGQMLAPDDSPMDRFFDKNTDAFSTFGEANEPGIAFDLLNCGQFNPVTEEIQGQPCFTEVGNFKRDPGVVARIGVTLEGGTDGVLVPAGGTRSGGVDPLLGLDLFLGSNLSLKNPRFRSLRCGECHAAGNLTDATFETSHQVSFGDKIQEFVTGQPGIEHFPEALGRGRVISGFLLEGELQENAQDGVERNVANFALDEGGFPQGQALFDNGMYNIGVTPTLNDLMRGLNDPFGFPLSLSILALKNLGGLDYSPGGDNPADGFAQPGMPGSLVPAPGIPLETFDPEAEAECVGLSPDELASTVECSSGGLFEETAQDQHINPGFGEEPANPLLPPYLAPWASNIPVGDESNIDEVFVGLNTLMAQPILEGFVDSFGPFNPAAILGEAFNNADARQMATWPNVNRVNRVGGVKAPPLRHVERTGPYFHNGGKLTLRQVVDFYLRGGDFPITNSPHRDFLIANLNIEDEALGGLDLTTGQPLFTETQKEGIRVALVDFLLQLTDERVDFQRAPFDQVEIFVPLDGAAPENGSLAGSPNGGRAGFLNNLANGMFLRVPATGAGGKATPTPNFLGISSGPRLVGAAANCLPAANNHYCH